MSHKFYGGCRIAKVAMLLLIIGISARASSDAFPVGIFDINSEVVLPNLEENLRFSGTKENRCVNSHGINDLFSILQHPSLAKCSLYFGKWHGEIIAYTLHCDSSSGTMGSARLHTRGNRILGVLEVKMGGKNMTFSQHITAKRIAGCES